MSRKIDLERHVRESYGLICEYEDILAVAGDPKEKVRARRAIDNQWALIEGYLAEYRKLAPPPWPAEMAEIAAHFAGPPPGSSGETSTAGHRSASTLFDQRGQQVQQQINVAGDYVDRRGTDRGDEE